MYSFYFRFMFAYNQSFLDSRWNNFGFRIYEAKMVAIRIRITISDGFPLYIWIKTIKIIYKTSIDVPISIVLLYKKRTVPIKIKTPAVIITALLSTTFPVWS